MSRDTSKSSATSFADYASFRKMVTPLIGVWIFWIGAALMLMAIGVAIVDGSGAIVLSGFASLLMWRLFCEFVMVMFMINQNLADIRSNTNQ